MPNQTNIKVIDLGYMDYQSTWDLQKGYHQKVLNGDTTDTLLLVEHESVYTLGKNANENHLLQSAPEDAKIFHIERGGDITYHGPGQLVGYPILDLHRYTTSISWYMRRLEQVIIDTLNEYEIKAARANINVYIESSVGIGEHPDLVSAIDSEMTKLAEAEDKLDTLKDNYLG